MSKAINFFALTAAATMAVSSAFAQGNDIDPQTNVKPASEVQGTALGVLECTIDGGWGQIFGSKKEVNCAFKHEDGTVEKYTGSLTKVGLDIGKTDTAYMTWIVFTPVGNVPGDHALSGEYIGVSAGASLGIGLGANALVGGSNKQFGLQPVSVEGTTGVNLAIGLSTLRLSAAM